ncbi:MAG: hypothetical protein JXA42_26620 [Anaerolineales bacterium]|nr:hypothetical protein [Anaerolineales bacterium]
MNNNPVAQKNERYKVLVLGGVSYNMMVYLIQFPEPRSQTLPARGYHETIGSTGAGKALNLHRLGMDVTLYGLVGCDNST